MWDTYAQEEIDDGRRITDLFLIKILVIGVIHLSVLSSLRQIESVPGRNDAAAGAWLFNYVS